MSYATLSRGFGDESLTPLYDASSGGGSGGTQFVSSQNNPNASCPSSAPYGSPPLVEAAPQWATSVGSEVAPKPEIAAEREPMSS